MARRPAPKKRGATTSRRRPARRREGFRLPGWLWGIAGLTAGFLLSQHQHGTAPWQEGHDSPLATVLPRPPASAPQEETPPAASEPRMPTFEFYTLLPESEVVAPRGEVAAAPPPPPAASEAPEDDPIAQVIAANLQVDANDASDGDADGEAPAREVAPLSESRYMLQAASFRESGDAEQLKQRLRNLSLVAQVSQVEASGGETWHRVQVGPYDDTRELSRAQDLMITQGIEPLLIRLQN